MANNLSLTQLLSVGANKRLNRSPTQFNDDVWGLIKQYAGIHPKYAPKPPGLYDTIRNIPGTDFMFFVTIFRFTHPFVDYQLNTLEVLRLALQEPVFKYTLDVRLSFVNKLTTMALPLATIRKITHLFYAFVLEMVHIRDYIERVQREYSDQCNVTYGPDARPPVYIVGTTSVAIDSVVAGATNVSLARSVQVGVVAKVNRQSLVIYGYTKYATTEHMSEDKRQCLHYLTQFRCIHSVLSNSHRMLVFNTVAAEPFHHYYRRQRIVNGEQTHDNYFGPVFGLLSSYIHRLSNFEDKCFDTSHVSSVRLTVPKWRAKIVDTSGYFTLAPSVTPV